MAHLDIRVLLYVNSVSSPPPPQSTDVRARVTARITDEPHRCMIIASYPSSYMNLWLKAEGFSVVKINELPTGYFAVTAVASWLGTTLAAIYSPWAIYTIQTVLVLFATLCMIIWRIPQALK